MAILLKVNSRKEIEIKTIEGEINMTFHKKFLCDTIEFPEVLKGAGIQRYRISTKLSQGKREYLDVQNYLKENSGEKTRHHQCQRIAMQGITGVDDKRRLVMTLVPSGFYLANSCNYILKPKNSKLEYILGILNSSLLNWVFKKTSTNSNVNCYEADKLPIPIASINENEIIIRVNQILQYKESDANADTSALEAEIDRMVYELYGLTEEEIKIVEGEIRNIPLPCRHFGL